MIDGASYLFSSSSFSSSSSSSSSKRIEVAIALVALAVGSLPGVQAVPSLSLRFEHEG